MVSEKQQTNFHSLDSAIEVVLKKSLQNLEIKQAHYLLSFILHYWYKNCITFMNLKMPPDFWAMSFLATESSFPRTESRWEAAQKPIAMATPWGQKVKMRDVKRSFWLHELTSKPLVDLFIHKYEAFNCITGNFKVMYTNLNKTSLYSITPMSNGYCNTEY